MNACYNCVDRHAHEQPDKVAIIHEADELGHERRITYAQLLRQVCQIANALKALGVRKGDIVAIYMPMIPETIVAMMACARIGAIHTVIFAGFSAESLRSRVVDSGARVIMTSDEGRRGGRNIATKRIVDEALRHPDAEATVEHVIVYRRTGSSVPWVTGRDRWWDEEISKARAVCPPENMNAEDPLFLLYTSGSAGAPKGVMHTTAGYLLGAAATTRYVFDCHPDDIFTCMADIAWITGHTYITYGPLAVGATTVLFESTPTYPNPSRFWDLIQRHRITHFYTAPTAIRALSRLGDQWLKGYDLTSLRVIGSVGEPINPEAWYWYYEKVGNKQCAVVDTYWQTETGSVIISPLPGATLMKPGSATLPFFGIKPLVINPISGEEMPHGTDETGVLVIAQPWPSMARTIHNNHGRFMDTYLKPYPGYYFTGDGASIDADGYIWMRGRVDGESVQQ